MVEYHQKPSQKHDRGPFVWWGLGFFSAIAMLLVVTLWMAGSVYSELPASASLGPSFKSVDVIVCLAGGRGRIRRALDLFEQGYGQVLYVSGTDKNANMRNILREIKWVGPIDSRRIILENISTNTIQNARQVAEYVRENSSKSVLIVTSTYHARRAHFVFRKILPPDVRIEGTWFEHEPFDREDWWKTTNGIWVTVLEFVKFFVTYLRLVA